MRDSRSQAGGNTGQETKTALIKNAILEAGEFFSKCCLTPRNRLIQLETFNIYPKIFQEIRCSLEFCSMVHFDF